MAYDRRRAYQLRHKRKGLCRYCPQPVCATSEVQCAKHLQAARQRQRERTGSKPWVKGKRGRPPNRLKFE